MTAASHKIAAKRGAAKRGAGGSSWWPTLLALAVVALVIFWIGRLWSIRPGSMTGMVLGGVATAFLLITALYGLRRRVMRTATRRRWGSARSWLQLHLFAGCLFLVLVLMHSGFRWPTGGMPWLLWLLSLWLVFGGLIGLGLQRSLPRLLASLATEVNFDRIPELSEEIRGRAEALAKTADSTVRALYIKEIRPALQAPHQHLGFLLDPTGGSRSKIKKIEYLHGFLSAEDGDKLKQLERLYRAKLELDAHYTLQRLLRGWLFLHLPPSLLLLVLVVLHIFTVLYY